jgi:hypothetical protein
MSKDTETSKLFPAMYLQITWLFLPALPIACVSWTITKEEVFKEPRDYCVKRNLGGKTFVERKFFTCLPANIV